MMKIKYQFKYMKSQEYIIDRMAYMDTEGNCIEATHAVQFT